MLFEGPSTTVSLPLLVGCSTLKSKALFSATEVLSGLGFSSSMVSTSRNALTSSVFLFLLEFLDVSMSSFISRCLSRCFTRSLFRPNCVVQTAFKKELFVILSLFVMDAGKRKQNYTSILFIHEKENNVQRSDRWVYGTSYIPGGYKSLKIPRKSRKHI